MRFKIESDNLKMKINELKKTEVYQGMYVLD